MRAKTIFIIIISVLMTIVLMKNTDEVNFWIFGDASVPKLAVLGVVFTLGLIVGFLLGRPRKKELLTDDSSDRNQITFKDTSETISDKRKNLSDEDRDYIN
jgi:hypothetical protein